MSSRALTWAFDLDLDDLSGKSALIALANYADDRGQSWPSLDRVATIMGCDARTAKRAIGRLERIGIITRWPRPEPADVYSLNFGWRGAMPDGAPLTTAPIAAVNGDGCDRVVEDDPNQLTIFREGKGE